jgi:DNA-directed RNA polymerase specialized sigma24 family protein
MSVRALHFHHPLFGSGDATRSKASIQLEPFSVHSLDPELSLYRRRTVKLLRRYLRLAIEAGRLPSLLGRECFRAQFTGSRAHTFEDTVIFVHDVERSLEELDRFDQILIALIVLEERSQDEAARLLGYNRRSVVRRFSEALDRVTEILLRRHVMERIPGGRALR